MKLLDYEASLNKLCIPTIIFGTIWKPAWLHFGFMFRVPGRFPGIWASVVLGALWGFLMVSWSVLELFWGRQWLARRCSKGVFVVWAVCGPFRKHWRLFWDVNVTTSFLTPLLGVGKGVQSPDHDRHQPPKSFFGSFLGCLGPSCRRSGASRGCFGWSCRRSGAAWERSGASWERLGASWGCLGAFWGRLGVV